MKELAELKEFTANFFKNLGAKTIWEGQMLRVDKVPKDFEDFFGKKSPLKLVFDRSEEGKDTELIAKGSFLLKAIALYLENKGQTTLLKLRVMDPKELLKHKVVFNDCDIFSFEKKHSYKTMVRFTFLTTFQYLNEKEQKMISIYLEEGKPVTFDEKRFQFEEGRKEDIEISGIKENYSTSKVILKELLKPQVADIGTNLKSKLSRELQRIDSHYKRQEEEIDKQVQSLNTQLKELEDPNSKVDKKNAELKLKRINEQLQKITEEDKKSKLKKEKDFLLNDEVQKHGLNMDTKLLNTTVIYYPVYECRMLLKNNEVIGKPLDFLYDSKESSFTSINCESCKESLSSLKLCSSGHVICKSCILPCKGCTQGSCKICQFRRCNRCEREYCKRCTKKCSRCFKEFCKTHVIPTSPTKVLCLGCSGNF
ncbi:hypothetical protein FJZ18_01020 [Candidatus Pacearchaeota archaeon]|nr:hypothetical protein [Candidatus Pacearchaeota archaeon]